MISPVLYGGCAVIGIIGAALVLLAGRGATALLLAAALVSTALWALAVAASPEMPVEGVAGALEVVRTGLWFGVLLHLGRRVSGGHGPVLRGFATLGLLSTVLAVIAGLPGVPGALALPTLGSPVLLLRLGLALMLVLLAENVFRNADDAARWHVNLPCIALGGLCAFDVVLYSDAALSGAFSPALLDARAALTALATPLLAVAAVRDRRWRRAAPYSRTTVFHGATLMVGGAFLLGVGAFGELLRHVGAEWAPAAQASLVAGAIMALAVGVTSRSTRSRLRRRVVDQFFTERYDYRREWMHCLEILSSTDRESAAPARALRALAEPVDSPAGAVLLRDAAARGFAWAGSWNLATATVTLAEVHPLLAALGEGDGVCVFGSTTPLPPELADAFGPLWLAVPLVHPVEGLLGAALLAPPRAPFLLDAEVFALLRAIGRESALFLAERRAAEDLAESRRLQDYAKRFAFVAHDVKTVSSQLGLLLDNAEAHLHDPEFQSDMLLTVRAAAARIDTLIARLRQPEAMASRPAPDGDGRRAGESLPLERLRGLAAARRHPCPIEGDGASPPVAVPPDAFDAAVGHLLNNAVEASRPDVPVRIRIMALPGRVVVDIIDRGPGMTPAFIRDELFRPLHTSKSGGDGIGAWQARELLREAGGELTVLSEPGFGTTMRLSLPVAAAAVAPPARIDA